MAERTQRADDPARNLTNVWLGEDPIRDTSRARYVSWLVWLVLWVTFSLLLWLVVPMVVLMAVVCLALADRVRTVITSRNLRIAFAVLIYAAVLLVFPTPAFWLYPLSGWVAWLPALVAAVLATRKLMPNVDANRPVSYWLNALKLAASGPRARRKPVARDLAEPTDSTPLDLSDLDIACLMTKEYDVARYEPITVAVEAERWLPGDHDKAANFRAWLSEHGFNHALVEARNGGAPSINIHPLGHLEVHHVQPGEWFIFIPAKGRRGRVLGVKSMPDKDFHKEYRAVVEVSA